MKRIYTKTAAQMLTLALSGMAIMGGLSSCDLDRGPTNSIPVDQSFETYDDAIGYYRGVMAQFRNRTTGVFVYPQEYQADYLNASAGFGNRSGDIHGWKDFTASNGDMGTIYSWYYSTLKNVNKTIERYPDILENLKAELEKAGNEESKANAEIKIKNVHTFMGVSYFVRAYYHFNLLLRFGTPYNPATAATDLGIPVVTVYEVSAQKNRNTVQEGYDQVFADIEQAEKYLVNRKGRTAADEITLDALAALRARIYLEMKKYDEAYSTASKIIQSGTYPLVAATPQAFENMWLHDSSTEDIFIMYLSLETKETPYTNGSYFGLDHTQHYHSPDFYPTQGLLDMYPEGDLRFDAYFYKAPEVRPSQGSGYKNSIYVVKKYKGNPEFATIKDDPKYGRVPNGYHRPRIFRVAEQYLIAAEAAYFSGKNALTPLNALRASRGLAPVTSSGAALLKDIQDERTRELAFEGFRLWDLRRWEMPVKRMKPQAIDGVATKTLFAAPYFELDIQPSDKLYQKTVWPIPQREISIYRDGVLAQNPGW